MIVSFTENKEGIRISNLLTSTYRIHDVYIDYYPNYTAYTPTSDPDGRKTFKISNIEQESQYYETTVDADLLCTKFGIDSLEGGLFYIWLHYVDTAVENPGDDLIFMDELADYDDLRTIGLRLANNYFLAPYCSIPKNFEEFCIYWNAIKLAVESEDWEFLNYLWGKIGDGDNASTPCPCNQ